MAQVCRPREPGRGKPFGPRGASWALPGRIESNDLGSHRIVSGLPMLLGLHSLRRRRENRRQFNSWTEKKAPTMVRGTPSLTRGSPLAGAAARERPLGARLLPSQNPAQVLFERRQELDEPRAHRVELNISRGRQQIRLIEHERGESPLPEMPAPTPAEVDRTRVTAVDLADRAAWFKKGSGIVAGTARRVLRTTIPDPFLNHARNCDEMNVIGHQAVRPDLDLVGGAPLRHELQVGLVIFIAKERLLPAVSPLGNVVRQARCDDSCQSGRDRRL